MLPRSVRVCGLVCAAITAAVVVGIAQRAQAQANAYTLVGELYNNQSYQQTSNTAPSSPFGYFFSVGAFATNGGDYSSATATYPGPASPLDLPLSPGSASSGGAEFIYNTNYYNTLPDLRNDFPFGTYQMDANGNSGPATSVIDYTADYFPSTVPYVLNFDSLDNYNPADAFVVDFPAFTPNVSASEGYTFFTIWDDTTGDLVFTQDFLDPSTTSLVIPGGTLAAKTQYDFALDFSNRFDGTDNTNSQFTVQGSDREADGSFITGNVPSPAANFQALFGFGLLLAFCRLGRRSRTGRQPLMASA